MTIAELNSPVSGNIEKLIFERGLKKVFVAEKANMTATSFADILNGRRLIKPCEIPVIAAAIGVEPNELFN